MEREVAGHEKPEAVSQELQGDMETRGGACQTTPEACGLSPLLRGTLATVLQRKGYRGLRRAEPPREWDP